MPMDSAHSNKYFLSINALQLFNSLCYVSFCLATISVLNASVRIFTKSFYADPLK
jgi:hypothetical protein